MAKMSIRETEEAFIHHAETGSRAVVVTFSHLEYEPKGRSFWGEGPLGKLGYSAVGVVAKRDIWYAPPVMDETVETVRQLASAYETIIIYGFSMGAYAALKYSSRIGADVTVALSPQASVDIEENHFIDRRFYNRALHQEMGIRNGDISGRAFLIYDPYMCSDNWSAQFVRAAHPETHLIPAPRAEHETIDLFSSTEALSQLLTICQEPEHQRMRELVRRLRKNAWRVKRKRHSYIDLRRERKVLEL